MNQSDDQSGWTKRTRHVQETLTSDEDSKHRGELSTRVEIGKTRNCVKHDAHINTEKKFLIFYYITQKIQNCFNG